MKNLITLIICVLLFSDSNAQPGEWVWVHGDNIVNAPGSFGTQGVSSPANKPPAVYEACEWTDLNGNFWMFGGLPSGFAAYGDLWKYDPVTNEWTWMKGSGVAGNTGSWGVQGVSSPANQPAAREHGVMTWTDLSNNLWMYGGYSVIGELSDLWKYDISTNEWTWMKGPQTAMDPGTYGTMGVPSPVNNPSSREETAASWVESNGDLWFFGGWSAGMGSVNDLWRYTIATNEWTWMRGSGIISQPGVYGTLGVEDPANDPASRCAYTHWKDLSGNFWMFGGQNFYAVGTDYNDVWRFNTLTNSWTWMNGSNVTGASPVYGIKCVTDSLNDPGTRYENRVSWTDASGNFWTFGGNRGSLVTNYNNDLWKYCVATNQWTWISGDNTPNPPGNWGTIGVSSPLNVPDGRMGSIGWRSNTGELYVFGGTSLAFGSFRNDLWKFTIDPLCGTCSSNPIALFNAPNHVCPGTCVDFNNISINATSFLWSFPGGNPAVSTDADPIGICYNTPGNYSVTLIATNPSGSDTLTLSNYITVYPSPPPQGIMQNGDTLFANPGATSYQWYYDGNLIPGATDYYYIAPQSGNYNVVATDENDCPVEAAIFDVIAAVSPLSLGEGSGVRLFPNPAWDKLFIQGNILQGKNVEVSIYNMIGELSAAREFSGSSSAVEIDISQLSKGMYWIEIKEGSIIFRSKITKH